MRLIRFYDNEQYHIDMISENKLIKSVKVPSQKKINIKERIEFVEDLMRYKDNKFFNYYIYPQIIEKAISNHKYPELNYDQTSGLKSADMDDILEWASLGGKAIVFDLDRTLIKTEGFGIFFRSRAEADKIFAGSLTDFMAGVGVPEKEIKSTIDDFLKYICGGEERRRDLINMFVFLSIYGVDVYINSSNEKCKSPLFREVVHKLFGTDLTIQCSGKNKLEGMMKSQKLRRMIDPNIFSRSATKIQKMVRRRSFRMSLKSRKRK